MSLSQRSVCQQAACINESMKRCQREEEGLFEHLNIRCQSKIVTEGDKLRDISSLGVKMADRWIAADRKSLCGRFTNLVALLNRKIHDSSLPLSVLTLLTVFVCFMQV